MKILTRMMLIAFLVAITGGVVILATSDIPAPVAPVEKVIPNDRLPR